METSIGGNMAYKNFTNCTEQEYYETIYSEQSSNRIKNKETHAKTYYGQTTNTCVRHCFLQACPDALGYDSVLMGRQYILNQMSLKRNTFKRLSITP